MRGGLRIVWDPSIDRGSWPGPLVGRVAVAGETWLGPIGLLARLETELGLGGIRATGLERAADLVSILSGRTGWWRASYDADPLGTCQRLLRDRDLLAMWGWRGEPASERLAGLWDATAHARPGVPDRLAAVIDALSRRRIDIAEIEMHSSPSMIEPLWQQAFARLVEAGIKLREVTAPPSAAAGDLANARRAGFVPTGDGSLTLLQPHGPLAAADEIAASLAALDSLEGVVVIGGDDVLDAALSRHGLPTLGASGRPTASSALLRLVIEAAFEPMDPAELHALLCLSPGPIPRRVASRLIRALGDFPGRRSPAWSAALAEGLARCDESWRDAAAARITTLLTPAALRDGTLDVTELTRRLDALAAWARAGIVASPSLAAIATIATEARELIAFEPSPSLPLVRLRRLCDELDRSSGFGAPAEAGLAAIAEPGALLAPARIVVWWEFTRDRAPSAPRLRLSNAERNELARQGVRPPDFGVLMEGTAARWRRPLDLAAEALVLVSPSTSAGGGPNFPHPLWDELRAAMPSPNQAGVLVRPRLTRPAAAPRRTAQRRALPAPATTIRVPVPVPLRERESPSSLEKLLGCSAAWALQYHGGLRGGLVEGPGAPTPLLYGNLAHHFMAKVFGDGALEAEAAATRAQALIDDELAALCETLALPRYQIELTAVRHAIVASARALGVLLTASGASVRGVELEHEGELDGVALRGKADLVLSTPDAVLDLKWGRTSNRAKLESGSALQLAIYAELLRQRGALPEVGYFTLQTQELFSLAGARLPSARIVGDASPDDTWRGALITLGERRNELTAGLLRAPAADGSEHTSELAEGRLTIAPECSYCAFGGLCGQGGCT